MKIVKIETEIEYIELKTPFVTALRTAWHVEFVRVHVACDNGFVAIGEAPATKAITGEDLETITEAIAQYKSTFYFHMPKDALKILHAQCEKMGSSAKAALDMAFVSLLAQEKNLPLYQYLGAKEATTLQTDVTISLNTPDAMFEEAVLACGNGLSILKVKLGADIGHAIEVTQRIAKAFPHVPERSDKCPRGAKVIIDANQSWSVQSCKHFIDETKNCKLELIEQPVKAEDLEGLKTLTEYSGVPILADEALFSFGDAKKVIETQSADMINIKLMKCGGVTKAVEILEYCREKGVACMLGSMLEGPHSINAALHLAMAYGDVLKYLDLDSPLLYKEHSDALDFEFVGCNITLKV